MKKRKVAIYEGHLLATLKSFTDAVMSIIATIMVLEIHLPKLIGAHGHLLAIISMIFVKQAAHSLFSL